VFASPEEDIIKEGKGDNEMYFIIQGDCVVNQLDKNQKQEKKPKLLSEGSHFGEIALIYDTNRTATVISRNYNSMA
jgi:CRP-like cAMP-binding protein